MPRDAQDPLYERIAAALREAITGGQYAAGARLPSHADLANEYGTTRPTISQALDVLRREGLVVSAPKSGTFVRTPPTIEIRSAAHYRRARVGEPGSPTQREAEREGRIASWDSDGSARVRADARIAERLRIAVGDYVMRTEYVFRADGHPLMLSTSWEPWAITGGTPVEEAEVGPVRGVVARMDSIGAHIDRVRELVSVRMATASEQAVLRIGDNVPVQQIERTYMLADGTAVETADITVPGDRYKLEYVIPID